MSRQINQPSNQIRLTNVSLVRLKKGKKRFEIACYKNKVLEWRDGIETDLDNVLQIPNVFLNVSKGQTAPREDLDKSFGKDKSVDDIVLEILKRGEMQVGEKERQAQLERVHHEVVSIVASKLVDPRTKRVYTTGMIEKALDMLTSKAHSRHEEGAAPADEDKEDKSEEDEEEGEAPKPKAKEWTGVSATKPAKSQALEAMKALIAHQPIPVARARMRLRVTCPTHILKQGVKSGGGSSKGHSRKESASGSGAKARRESVSKARRASVSGEPEHKVHGTVKDHILSYIEEVESQDVDGNAEWDVVGFAEPGALKELVDFIGNETKGKGKVEVLDMAITHEDLE